MYCEHKQVRCLNQYETFRKYQCENCGGVFICECERGLALAFLPHQIQIATEYGTQRTYAVNGFALNICAECRGVIDEAHPRAAIYGQKGKVERYYWREIDKTYYGYALTWLNNNSERVRDIDEFQARFPDEAEELQKMAKQHWQNVHTLNPKYDIREETEAQILSRIIVPINKITAEYRQIERNDQKIGQWVGQGGDLVSVEQIAAEWYAQKGYTVLRCERVLISSLVATLLARSIQTMNDPRMQTAFRNSTRGWTSQNRNTPLITISLPEDFGSASYYERRKDALRSSIQKLEESISVRATFDQLLAESESLRDYLWVNNNEAVETTRIALNILSKEQVIACVKWVIQDFWQRQPGWPDFVMFRNSDFRFVEVKSPHDKLSKEQMNWFKWAVEEANIPCEICRVERE